MKVYVAKCITSDPDIVCGSQRTAVLGIFSCREMAEEAFTREEERKDRDGWVWTAKHICFEGSHEIEEYELDKWFPLGQ